MTTARKTTCYFNTASNLYF